MKLIYCASGNKRFADIAIKHNFAYGAQLPSTIYHAPYFVDQDWRKPNRAKYMAALSQHRPSLATVLDWERDEQFDEVLEWASEAAQFVNEVIIIPKVRLGVSRIPDTIGGKPVRLGYSVPTKYAGTTVHPYEFGTRPVHLLGGSPQKQIELSKLMNVVSADGNYSQKLANRCQFFTNGYAVKAKNKYAPQLSESAFGRVDNDAPYLAFELSCLNIKSAWAGSPALVRFVIETDLSQIVKIARQYDKQLGYVRLPGLRESLAKHTLLVAEMPNRVVGFVNYHARRDGWQTIYEIAVDRDFVSSKIGAGLLAAVPRPTQLKCVLTNMRANYFYSDNGFEMVGTESGKHRALGIWRSEA